MGLFCEDCGACTPGPSTESCYCRSPSPDPYAAQRNRCYYPLPHTGQQVAHIELNIKPLRMNCLSHQKTWFESKKEQRVTSLWHTVVLADALLLLSSSDLMHSIYHREEVNDYLHEIYFLPDHPELKDIHTVLQDYKKVSMNRGMVMIMMMDGRS